MKLRLLTSLFFISTSIVTFAQQAETLTKTLVGTNISNGSTIINGSATLTKDGEFLMFYDFILKSGSKNRVRISATGCKPNIQCESLGSWQVTNPAIGYSGQMQGTQQTIKVNVIDGVISGFSS